jgi:hypothetical protein
MKSRLSNSLALVWRVADFEARRLNSPLIEPLHLFLSLCKVVDLDLPELVSKDSPDRDEVLEELLREVRRIRGVFRAAGLDAKRVRRRLRKASFELRPAPDDSEGLHRSPAARLVFADAERLAKVDNSNIYPVHLLYASLITSDEQRDATLAELNIDKKKLANFAKVEMLTPQNGPPLGSKPAKARWN